MRTFAKIYFKLFGWKILGQVPEEPKWIAIFAPHTSNWDFMPAICIKFYFRVRAYWLAKDSLFNWPYGYFFSFLGGLAVNRSSSNDLVGDLVSKIKARKRIVLALAPEGTRKYKKYWKSGFYHIAREANIPIVLVFLDYGKRELGIGPVIRVTDNIRADMDKIRSFYEPIKGEKPECFGRIKLKEEEEL